MRKYNLKWTSMVVAITVSAVMTACSDGSQEQSVAEETGNMEMAEGMEMEEGMGEMDGMDMAQDEAAATEVSMEGEPAFVVAYMDLKNALVNDDEAQVKQAASSLQENLEASDLSEEQRNQLKESAGQIAQAQGIETQRQAFAQLSRQLYEVVKNKDVTGNTLYWQHCPMALNGEGANWLSFEEKVRNPFMGQKMPGCGSVEETI